MKPTSPAGTPVTPIQPLPQPRGWRTPGHFTSTVCGIVEAAEDFLEPTQALTFLEAIHGVISAALAKCRRQFAQAGAMREMAGIPGLAGVTTADLEGNFRNVTERLQIREGHGENTIRRTPTKTVVTWQDGMPVTSEVPVYDDCFGVGSPAAAVPASVPANN